jgi:anti-anti-sigma factor
MTGQAGQRRETPEQVTEAGRRGLAARDVAAGVQEALLPATLPVLPRARIAARYLAAGQELTAGGDWFDAVPLAGGRVALIVGDVVGHGVAASVAMGQLRAVLNELLIFEQHLPSVLTRADAFAGRNPALRAATLAIAELDPVHGTLRYATYGHPPPLIIGTDGSSRYLPGTAAGPLGSGSSPALATSVLQPGELVLLYSNGLIQRPNRTVAESMADLEQAAGGAGAHQAQSCDAVSTPPDRVCQRTVELLTRTGYTDDVTVLAAQRLASAVPALHLELPGEAASVTTVRRAFGEWLAQVDAAAAQDGNDLQLAIVEIVTNAIEHAYSLARPGLIDFRAALGDDGNLECQITDRGIWRVPDPAVTSRGHGLMVASQVVDQMQIRHPPQADGSQGTMVMLRHALRRPVILAPDASGHAAAGHAGPPFALDIETDGGVACARVSGPVDITTADRLARQLLTASRGGTLPLTTDLTGVTHLASAGVRALYQVREQLAAHRQELTILAAPGSSASLVLRLVHLVRE